MPFTPYYADEKTGRVSIPLMDQNEEPAEGNLCLPQLSTLRRLFCITADTRDFHSKSEYGAIRLEDEPGPEIQQLPLLQRIHISARSLSEAAGLHKSSAQVPFDLTEGMIYESSKPFAISPCCDLFSHFNQQHGTVVVRRIRFFDDGDDDGEHRLWDTTAKLVRAYHKNVLPYLGVCLFEDRACIVSALAGNGDLKAFLVSHPETNRSLLVSHIVAGLTFLHDNGVVHGNLHTRNILISHAGIPMLSDFGLGTLIPSEGKTSMRPAFYREKVMHRAPEVNMGAPLSQSSDVYSFGMLAFYVYCDTPPMAQQYPGAIQVAAALLNGRRPSRSEITRADFNDRMWALVQACWAHNEKARPTMTTIFMTVLFPPSYAA